VARRGLLPIKDIVRGQFLNGWKESSVRGRASREFPRVITELDKLTSGLQPSELLILAARPFARENGAGAET